MGEVLFVEQGVEMELKDYWDDFIVKQSPEIYSTFTFPNDFFIRKEGERTRKIETSSQEGAIKHAVKGFLYSLSRATKQHIRLFYGVEDNHKIRPHIHGLMCFEHGAFRVIEDASKKYRNNKIESVGDAFSQLWSDYLAFQYKVFSTKSPNQFSLFDSSLARAGSYSCLKHSSGELIMDVCPRHRNICKKWGGECVYNWEVRNYNDKIKNE
jgi:hypothetical protein